MKANSLMPLLGLAFIGFGIFKMAEASSTGVGSVSICVIGVALIAMGILSKKSEGDR